MTNAEFDVAWRTVAHQVLRMCRHAFNDDSVAEEVAQRVAVRAWRGSATFRGDAPFVVWVCNIAKNEIRRMIDALQKERKRISEISEHENKLVTPSVVSESSAGWITMAISEAITEGSVTEDEGRCLLARLENPDSWDDVSVVTGLSATHCAVLHCRAIPKLRVHMFLRYGARLWSRDTLEDAIRHAVADRARPLTNEEEEVFRRVVIEKDESFHRRGSRGTLRSACDKIILRVGYVFDAPEARF